MSEKSFSQVPCGEECFTYWPKVYKEVLCAEFKEKKKASLGKTVFIFDFVTTILETLFNAFSHRFAYIRLGFCALLSSRAQKCFLNHQIFRKDFHWHLASDTLPFTC